MRITPPDALDAAGQLPLVVDASERPLRVVDLGVAWSTDLGGNATASWHHRNLFGNAEQLTVSGGVTNLGGTAAKAPGYNAAIKFLKPDFLAREALAAGRLRALLDAQVNGAGRFQALWPSNRNLSPKVRVFVDFLAERLFRDSPP